MYLVFDIGGTHMRMAASIDGNEFAGSPIKINTPQNFEDGIRALKESSLKVVGNDSIDAVVGGIAGPLNEDKSALIRSPHLPGWISKPLKKELEGIAGAKVLLENDAALAGLGEALRGGGRGHHIVAYITLSTGIGGVRVVDGKIDTSTIGFEIGHQRVMCHGTGQEFFEDCISGSALEKQYGKPPFKIHDKAVWEEIALVFAEGLNNTIVHWSPNIIILGGALSEKIPLDIVTKRLSEILTIFPTLPKIQKSTLGDANGLYGALEYAKQKLS